ncbi:glycosyltransferase family 4 protein [Geodermatophilus sabuli]|nr:glycosyltransferase family 4 protein [Geodermatophilus sabuli]
MRVTYVLHTAVWGGAETYVARLIQELLGRMTPTVVAPRPVPERLLRALPSGVEVRTVDGVGRKGDLGALVRLVRTVRSTRPDLVHVNQSTPANNRYGLLAARLSGAPFLSTVHSPEPARSRPQKLLLPLLFRDVRTVITVSDETQELLVRTLRVPSARIRVVPNGVPLPDRPARRRTGGGQPVVAGSVGRLVREKGFDVLLDALDLVVRERPGVCLRIAGEGPQRATLEARAHDLPVSLVGEVTDTASFLDDLDVFCLSSRREGLPFALLEAMAMGVPCIATDVGQVRTALGAAVLVVPPEQPSALAQALRQLADAPSVRASLGEKGRALVENRYDVRLMAARTMELYEQAVTRATDGRREPERT